MQLMGRLIFLLETLGGLVIYFYDTIAQSGITLR